MKAVDLETGPKQLPEHEVLMNEKLLQTGVILIGEQDGQFRKLGVLRLIYGTGGSQIDTVTHTEKRGLPFNAGLLIWSARLLDLEPDQYQARIDVTSGGLARIGLIDNKGRYLGNIYPKDLRVIVDPLCGRRVAGHSRFLLKEDQIDRRLDEALKVPQQGRKPASLDNGPFARVSDETPVGKRFMLLWFNNFTAGPTAKPKLEVDAVVIDPEARSLVPRVVERPLAFAKWGEDHRNSVWGAGSNQY